MNQYSHTIPYKRSLFVLAAFTSFSTLTPLNRAAAAETPPVNEDPELIVTPALRIEAASSPTSDPLATEHSGSYASDATGIFKSPRSVIDTPVSVSTITRQRIDDENLFSIQQVLDAMPGLTYTQTGEDASFRSRAYGISTQVDGMPLSSGSRANRFDTAIYDRVELVRGPAGTVQGVGAIGGVINLVRKRPTHTLQRIGQFSAGSWNEFRGMVDVSGPLNKEASLRGRAVVSQHQQDYFYDVVDNRNRTAYGVIEVDVSPATTLGLNTSWTDNRRHGQNYGIPEQLTRQVSRRTYPGVDWTGAWLRAHEVGVDLTHEFSNEWTATLRYLRRQSNFEYKYLVPLGLPATFNDIVPFLAYAPQGRDRNDAIDMQLSGSFELFGHRHALTVGANYDRSETLFGSPSQVAFGTAISPDIPQRVLGSSTDDTRYKLVQWAPYVQAQLQLADPLLLTLGGRQTRYRNQYNYIRTAGTTNPVDYGKENGKFTPYAGLSYSLTPDASLYASYTDIFNPQTGTSFEGVAFPPVLGWQAEIGAKSAWFNGRLIGSIGLYRLREENRAMPDPDPAHLNCGYVGGTCYVATGLVQSQGVDMELSGQLGTRLQLQGSYTYNKNEYLSDYWSAAGMAFVTSSPQHLFKLWASYQFGPMIGTYPGRWNVAAGLQARSKTSFGEDNPHGQGGHAITSLQLGYRFNPDSRVTLTVDNLFDRTYLASVSQFNFYGEPRSVQLSWQSGF